MVNKLKSRLLISIVASIILFVVLLTIETNIINKDETVLCIIAKDNLESGTFINEDNIVLMFQ